MPDLKRLGASRELTAARKDNGWQVSGGKRMHRVSGDATQCDCEDFTFRRTAVCKHIYAVQRERGDPDVKAALKLITARGGEW